MLKPGGTFPYIHLGMTSWLDFSPAFICYFSIPAVGAEVPQIPNVVLHYSPLGTEKKLAGQEAQIFFLLVISIPISQ